VDGKGGERQTQAKICPWGRGVDGLKKGGGGRKGKCNRYYKRGTTHTVKVCCSPGVRTSDSKVNVVAVARHRSQWIFQEDPPGEGGKDLFLRGRGKSRRQPEKKDNV